MRKVTSFEVPDENKKEIPDRAKPPEGGNSLRDQLVQQIEDLKRATEEEKKREQARASRGADMMKELVLDIAEQVAARQDLAKLLKENADIFTPPSKQDEITGLQKNYTREVESLEATVKRDEEALTGFTQALENIGDSVSSELRTQKEKVQEGLELFTQAIEESRKQIEAKRVTFESEVQKIRERMRVKGDQIEVREHELEPLNYAIDTMVSQYQAKWEEAEKKGEVSGENPFTDIDKGALREKITQTLIIQVHEKRSVGVRAHEAQTVETEKKKI